LSHEGSSFHIPAIAWQLRCYSSSVNEREGIDKNWKSLLDAAVEREVQREQRGVAGASHLTGRPWDKVQYHHQSRVATFAILTLIPHIVPNPSTYYRKSLHSKRRVFGAYRFSGRKGNSVDRCFLQRWTVFYFTSLSTLRSFFREPYTYIEFYH
jgi:hypothetical protein